MRIGAAYVSATEMPLDEGLERAHIMEEVSATEAAALTGLSERTIRRKIARGELAARHVAPNRYAIRVRDLPPPRHANQAEVRAEARMTNLEARLDLLERRLRLVEQALILPHEQVGEQTAELSAEATPRRLRMQPQPHIAHSILEVAGAQGAQMGQATPDPTLVALLRDALTEVVREVRQMAPTPHEAAPAQLAQPAQTEQPRERHLGDRPVGTPSRARSRS